MKVFVIHRYGAPRHFDALRRVVEKRGGAISWINLNVLRRLGKALLRNEWKLVPGVVKGICALMYLLIGRGQVIVIGVEPYSAWALLILWLRRRHRVIYYSSWPYWSIDEVVHNPGSSFWARVWKRALTNLLAVGVSHAATDGIKSYGAVVTKIPHCVDTKVFTVVPRQHGSERPLKILFVGRLVEEKGVLLLIEIAKKLMGLNIAWQFAGDGPLTEALERAKNHGLNVVPLGQLSQKALVTAYQQADIFVLPSFSTKGWEELFGIAIIEAYATGLPVIATDCVGPLEIIEPWVDGVIVRQRDADELGNVLQALLRDNRMRSEMGRKAREKTERVYSEEIVAVEWARVLDARSPT